MSVWDRHVGMRGCGDVLCCAGGGERGVETGRTESVIPCTRARAARGREAGVARARAPKPFPPPQLHLSSTGCPTHPPPTPTQTPTQTPPHPLTHSAHPTPDPTHPPHQLTLPHPGLAWAGIYNPTSHTSPTRPPTHPGHLGSAQRPATVAGLDAARRPHLCGRRPHLCTHKHIDGHDDTHMVQSVRHTVF